MTAVMSAEVRKILKCSIWALIQYGDPHHVRATKDNVILDHWNMAAGEDLYDMLAEYGLAEDDGHSLSLTAAGLALVYESEG